MTTRGARVAVLAAGFCMACASSDPPAADPESLAVVPAGIRRLTSYEYDRVASQLLGRDVEAARDWPSDVPQQGFSRNRAQIVDSVLAVRLDEGAALLASGGAASELARGVSCHITEPDCSVRVVRALVERAFRRAASETEVERYRALLTLGGEDGVALVLRALLQSPNTLYVTETGPALDDDELANALAFSLTGLPPDDELRAAARVGSLRRADARLTQARRLLGSRDALAHYQRFVEEWLGISQLESVSKDTATYPSFSAQRAGMLQDARSFVARVMIEQRGSLPALLSDVLASGRVGLLEHPSFLAAHAHPTSSAPVLRGAAVLRRVLCRVLPNPNELGIDIVFPPPAPLLTTRERYASHAAEPLCFACHDSIDEIGFTFEAFDAVGDFRTSEADKPIDSSGAISLGSGVQPLAGSADLARALAHDPEVEACLARQVFRFVTGVDEPEAETAFVSFSATLPESERATLLGLVLGYVGSPLFAARVVP